MIRFTFDYVRGNPQGCCRELVQSGAVSYVNLVTVLHTDGITVFDVAFEPAVELKGYPVEQVKVSVLADSSIAAVPVGESGRPWHHRYPRCSIQEIIQSRDGPVHWLSVVGGLCLWYPGDPPAWRWTWDQGFDTYLQLVQRHTWAEEYYRRHGEWPVEDAPHGERPDGNPHPFDPALLRCA